MTTLRFDAEAERVRAGIKNASSSAEAKALALLLLTEEDSSLPSALRRIGILPARRGIIAAINSGYTWTCNLCGYRDKNSEVWSHIIDTCGPAHLVQYAEQALKEK